MLRPSLWIEALINEVAFPLRAAVRWRRRKPYEEGGGSLEALLATHASAERVRALHAAYAFEPSGLSSSHLLLNFDWLDVLDRVRTRHGWQPGTAVRALDVGSKNFYYAAALSAFWRKHGELERLDGVEIDGHRVYRDGFSRADYARWYARQQSAARFIVDDVMNYRERVNAITHFYPFLTETPLVRWGLPLRYLNPAPMFEHLYGLLESGGIFVIVNQGLDEAKLQRELLESLSIRPAAHFELSAPLYEARKPKWVTVLLK